MLSPKTKGLFIDVNDFSVQTAVTTSLLAPFKIESLKEFSLAEINGGLREFVLSLLTSKTVRYVPSVCGIYPESRFFRRHTMESMAKAKDTNFFAQLLQTQFRIDPGKHAAAVINATDGSEFDLSKPLTAQKELLFCGASNEELLQIQETLVDKGKFPSRIEIGTLASLGGLVHYSRVKSLKLPTLVLEVTQDSSNLFILSSNMLEICRPIPFGLEGMLPLIQEELGLKDVESARKLLFSNTFDFTEMGTTLLRKMLKELQASTGFYEVQTGQTIGQLYMPLLPKNLGWIQQVLSRHLGVKVLKVDYAEWLDSLGITADDSVNLSSLDARWHGLISLMGEYTAPEKNGDKKG